MCRSPKWNCSFDSTNAHAWDHSELPHSIHCSTAHHTLSISWMFNMALLSSQTAHETSWAQSQDYSVAQTSHLLVCKQTQGMTQGEVVIAAVFQILLLFRWVHSFAHIFLFGCEPCHLLPGELHYSLGQKISLPGLVKPKPRTPQTASDDLIHLAEKRAGRAKQKRRRCAVKGD